MNIITIVRQTRSSRLKIKICFLLIPKIVDYLLFLPRGQMRKVVKKRRKKIVEGPQKRAIIHLSI